MTKIVPEVKAKQGRSGQRVLAILIGSLLLAAVVWVGLEAYGEFIQTPQTQQN